jgi:hypothetical protein
MIIMKILPLLLLLPLTVNAAYSCDRDTRKIDNIKAKMRQGYSVTQGEYLKKRLTQLQDDRITCERKVEQIKKKNQQKHWIKKNVKAKQALKIIANQHKISGNWTATSSSETRIELRTKSLKS